MTIRKALALIFVPMTLGFAIGQGVHNESGSANAVGQTGGYTWIGDSNSTYLSLDPNEVQARNGALASTLFFNFWGGDIDLIGSQNGTGDLKIDGSGIFYKNSDNNVGLGTTNPLSRLHLADGQIRIDGNGDRYTQFMNGVLIEGRIGQAADNSINLTNFTGAPINFFTGNGTQQALQLQNNGAAHFQGPENDGTVAALKIESPFAMTTVSMLLDGNEIDSEDNLYLNFNSNAPVLLRNANQVRADVTIEHGSSSGEGDGFAIENEGANNNYWTFFVSNSSGEMELYFDGNKRGDFDDVSGAYTSVSDKRLKSNIRDMSSVLDRVMRSQPRVYSFGSDKSNRDYMGFVAQEMEKLFPEIVHRGKVGDTKEELYTMDYSALGTIAIQAVKEQQEIIEELKAENLLINSRLESLETKLELLLKD